MITGAQIVDEARLWIGTPWKHAQACKGAGCDCIGLVGGVAAAVGVTNDWITEASMMFKGYGRLPVAEVIYAGCERWMLPVKAESIQLGDILVMAFEKEAQHFAIVSNVSPRYIIHAYAQARRVAENRVDETWQRRTLSAWRLKGVA